MGNVSYTRSDGVATITIDASEVRNAISPQLGLELAALCDEIDADASLGCVVIRGAGGTFCSGADTRTWAPDADQSEDQRFKNFGAVYQAFMRVGTLAVPVVAAVRGAAVGAGLNLMLAADLRIVADDAKLIAGFLRIGLHPGGGFFTLAGRLAGREATAAIGLFGEQIDGRRAVELGLAWQSLPDPDVEERAHELAARAAHDPELMRAALRSMRAELGPPSVPWAVAVEYERATQMWSARRRVDQ